MASSAFLPSLVLAAALPLASASFASPPVEVQDAWLHPTIAQQRTTAAFVRITSPDAARLVEARSPAAAAVELHRMAMDGGVMTMRAVDTVDLPAGQPITLSPAGTHMMLVGLAKPVNAGDEVPITLVVEHAGGRRETIDLKATARPFGAAASAVMGAAPAH